VIFTLPEFTETVALTFVKPLTENGVPIAVLIVVKASVFAGKVPLGPETRLAIGVQAAMEDCMKKTDPTDVSTKQIRVNRENTQL